jgi:nitroimidazol reductase NimA-like FMN-containing flavoprotein (pyridoxamine 5'-phosphate oxidase superfamily)
MTTIDDQIAVVRAEVLELDRAYQHALATGNYRFIKAAEESYNLAHSQLGRLVQRRINQRN